MKFHYYMFAILIIASVFLIGGGITGRVISQSCCFPPNCEPENVCDAAKSSYLESPMGVEDEFASYITTLTGLFILLGAIILLHAKHKTKNKVFGQKK